MVNFNINAVVLILIICYIYEIGKMYTRILVFFTVFLKNRNISSKIKRSKVTDYMQAFSENKYRHFKNDCITYNPFIS